MLKRVYLWLAGLALVALALLLTDRLLWAPGLTEDNVRRIRSSMTLAEVEALRADRRPGKWTCARRRPASNGASAGCESGWTTAPAWRCSSSRTAR
jgi:hypothetical protein